MLRPEPDTGSMLSHGDDGARSTRLRSALTSLIAGKGGGGVNRFQFR